MRHESAVEVTVGGVSMLPALARRSLAWELPLNGRSTASLTVFSRDNTLASPAFRDPVVVTVDGVDVFGGVVLDVDRRTVVGKRGAAFTLQCGGWEAFAETTMLNGILHGPLTLRAAFEAACANLAPLGITVDPAMSAGGTLDTLTLPWRMVSQAWDEMCALAGAQWRISPGKLARAEAPGVLAAPFALGVGGEPVSVRGASCGLVGADYKNRVWVRFGTTGQTRDVVDTLEGNGTRTVQLSYQPDVAPTLLTLNGSGHTLAPGNPYEYREGPGRIVARLDRPVFDPTDVLEVAFTAAFPSVVFAQDDAQVAAYGEVTEVVDLPDVYDAAAARAWGDAWIAVRANLPRVATLTIWDPGIEPGMVVAVNLPALEMSGDWLCTRVKGAHLLKTRRDPARHTFGYELELVEGGVYRDGWERYFRELKPAAGSPGLVDLGGQVDVYQAALEVQIEARPVIYVSQATLEAQVGGGAASRVAISQAGLEAQIEM